MPRMPATNPRTSPFALLLLALSVSATSLADTVDFQHDILPVLAETCFACHGPDAETREADLRLDLREDALQERDGHPAIVPGSPEMSELIRRITAEDSADRMPPVGSGKKLSADEIEKLRRWIADGAPYAQHWSFERPVSPGLPDAHDSDWARGAIDTFVLRRLKARGLSPSPEADREVLARRVALDLTGLPPTPEEVDSLVNDPSPQAYESYVDRVLQSPSFGERWGRVWLDLARYADSAGYAQDPQRVIWMYRDWVIDALNANTPFDEFTIQQLAGDMLPDPDRETLIATAFHRNTQTNSEGGTDDEEFRNAAIVDRVNTTFQVWMGVTMGCAQCHTHKYDPITQKEYFQVFAIFNNTEDADRGDEQPVLYTMTEEHAKRRAELEAEIAPVKERVEAGTSAARDAVGTESGPLETRYLRIELTGTKKRRVLSLAEVEILSGEENVAAGGEATQSGRRFGTTPDLAIDGDQTSVTHTKGLEVPFWEVDLGRAHRLDRIKIWDRSEVSTGLRVVAFDGGHAPLWIRSEDPSGYAPLVIVPPRSAGERSADSLATLREYPFVPTSLREEGEKLKTLEEELSKTRGIPTPILRELPPEERRTTRIQVRGNFRMTEGEVSPGVPAAFHPLKEEVNRLSLAHWLVEDENPLTARVLVNRHWEQIFGRGLVETSEDFGIQGEAPSHPELLDYLAVEFAQRGWDVKQLLRSMVTSSTYRQTSRVTPELEEKDPFNRDFSRGPRFRLSAETIRDQALFVAGLLSRKMHGPSVRPPRPSLGLKAAFGGSTDWETSAGEDRYRRGLYTRWRRTTPYPSMTTFDAPSREFCTVRRIRTNTPLQALVTLNDPVFVEAAQAFGRRMLSEGGPGTRDGLEHGFRLCLGRFPTGAELDALERLHAEALSRYRNDEEAAESLATDPLGPVPPGFKESGVDFAALAAWTVAANVLLNLDEFLARR